MSKGGSVDATPVASSSSFFGSLTKFHLFGNAVPQKDKLQSTLSTTQGDTQRNDDHHLLEEWRGNQGGGGKSETNRVRFKCFGLLIIILFFLPHCQNQPRFPTLPTAC